MNKSPSLSKYEIACVTAGVPATGDPLLDQIITQGLRFKTAAEIVAAYVEYLGAKGHGENLDTIATRSVAMADALLAEFRKPSDDK